MPAKSTHVYPAGRFQSMLRAGGFAPRVSKKCGAYVAATISYLTHELLEMASKAAGTKRRLTPSHLTLAIGQDQELGALLGDVTISRASVVPNILPAIQHKKKNGKKGKSAAKKATTKTTKTKSLASLKKQTSKIGDVTVGGAALTRQQSTEIAGRARDAAVNFKWQYKADNGSFQDYDKNASIAVEMAYQSWLLDSSIDVRSVQSGDWEYMVDFNLMTQQNTKHHAHKIRAIKRAPVAGRK